MAIVFDATLGADTATSYITVARADELLPVVASKARTDAWLALATPLKEGFLMRAVRTLEQYFAWEGSRSDEYQARDWPREWVYGPDRAVPYDSNTIPTQVEEAQALMALAHSEGFDAATASVAPVDYVKVSSISVSFASERAARSATLVPHEVIEKLHGFADYTGASGMARSIPVVR